MRTKRILTCSKALTAAALVGLLSATALGTMTEQVPVGYGFDAPTGDVGGTALHDWTGEQLIDGQYGTADWTADLGNGPAYEWVGWIKESVVNIDFDFGSPARIDEIRIGSVQGSIEDAVLPDVAILTGNLGDPYWWYIGSQTVAESSANDETYRTYTFPDLEIDHRYVRVRLMHNLDGPGTLIDEIDFYTYAIQPDPEPEDNPQHMPEPMTMVGLLAGMGGLGAYLKRRRDRRD